MHRKQLAVAILVVLGALLLGSCSVFKSAPDDKAITSEIQAKLFADPVLKTRDIQVAADHGVVTLAGTVSTDLEKSAVERIASQTDGVKTVVDNLTVASAAVPAEQPAMAEAPAPPASPAPRQAQTKPRRERASSQSQPAEAEQAAYNEVPAQPQPAPMAAAPAPEPAVPAKPAPPPIETVTIPTGTVVTVRMIDSIDSKRNTPGEEFAASVDQPVVVGNRVIIPKNSDARVRLIQAQNAGRLKGQSALQLELVELVIHGAPYNVASGAYEQHGASRGKRTAETVGGGALIGGLIGAIAGKGKGAAIGAAVGAGAGAGVQVLTHGEAVRIPSETKLDFTLKSAVPVEMPSSQ